MKYIKLTLEGGSNIRLTPGSFNYVPRVGAPGSTVWEPPNSEESWRVQETPEQIDQLIRDAGWKVVGIDSQKPLKLPDVGKRYKANWGDGLLFRVIWITDDQRVLLYRESSTTASSCKCGDFWELFSETDEGEK